MDYEQMVEELKRVIREAPLSMVPALFLTLTEEVIARKAFTRDGIVRVVMKMANRENESI